jgi:translation elongation factor EF-Ts
MIIDNTKRKSAQIGDDKVSALRTKTGQPIRMCRKALYECCGDAAAAEEWLRRRVSNPA